jgi:hypothetical protein
MLWDDIFEVLSVILPHVNFFHLFWCNSSSSISIIYFFKSLSCPVFWFRTDRLLLIRRDCILLEFAFIGINARDVLSGRLFIFLILDYFEIRLHYYN